MTAIAAPAMLVAEAALPDDTTCMAIRSLGTTATVCVVSGVQTVLDPAIWHVSAVDAPFL